MKPSMPYCDRCSEYGHYPSQHQHADSVVTVILACWCGRRYVGPSDAPARNESCAACGGPLEIEDSEVNRKALAQIDGRDDG